MPYIKGTGKTDYTVRTTEIVHKGITHIPVSDVCVHGACSFQRGKTHYVVRTYMSQNKKNAVLLIVPKDEEGGVTHAKTKAYIYEKRQGRNQYHINEEFHKTAMIHMFQIEDGDPIVKSRSLVLFTAPYYAF